jgi:hypothetical protein
MIPIIMEATATAPITGWDRKAWTDLADRMLLAVRPYASPNHGQIIIPGEGNGFGAAVDGLEGFARTFLLAGFRLIGEDGNDPLGLADWYAQGIAAGTDPESPDNERWPRLSEIMQAKVEAASIAMILGQTKPWIWDKLEPQVQRNVIEYLSEAVGDNGYVKNNWLWFRLIVQTFLRSVGGPYSQAEMEADLVEHDSYYRSNGWLSDGAARAFDHYEGWAMHLYPTLWAKMDGAEDLAKPRHLTDQQRLARYLQDAIRLVGSDGAPMMEGRSLVYRFAAAAPYWLGCVAEVDSVPFGQLRRAASGILDYFVRHGAPDLEGLLKIGWFDPWLPLAQGYSGSSSPYWAVKGMLGIMLPAEHPAWKAIEEPLPSETDSYLFDVPAAGWLVSNPVPGGQGTAGAGVVRVINHGTDIGFAGDENGDSPLYARLGYSTATFPWIDPQSLANPSDNMVGLVDQNGRVTHRSGFTILGTKVEAGTGVAASRGSVRWLDKRDTSQPDTGRGWVGEFTTAGELTLASVVRGKTELRLARVERLAPGLDEATLRLRFTGWPTVSADGLHSSLRPASPIEPLAQGTLSNQNPELATPLGGEPEVPFVDYPVVIGQWFAVAIELA